MNRIWKAITVAGAAAVLTALTCPPAQAEPSGGGAELLGPVALAALDLATPGTPPVGGPAIPPVGGTIAGAPAVAPRRAVPAIAATPVYTCDDVVTGKRGGALATGDCVATGRGPTSGPIYGYFLIRGRTPARTLRCLNIRRQPSGVIDIPRAAAGYLCKR